MKYEAPEMNALTPAINAVHGTKPGSVIFEGVPNNEASGAYEDWEDLIYPFLKSE